MTLRDLKSVLYAHTKVIIVVMRLTRETLCFHSSCICVYNEYFDDVNIDNLLDHEVQRVFCHDNIVYIDIIELVNEDVVMY